MPNRLAEESSLYLQQHANNPVEWFPWGDEALSLAEREDKPILISIGYSACHWCHVMAHESFEDEYIASLMNQHFVCIKVDREERPDIDHIYMEAVQMMNGGQGGWPLNVFCLPDGRPFAGGTYFPPDDHRGLNVIPWPQLLMRVSDFYRRSRPDLEENADAVIKNMEAGNIPIDFRRDAELSREVLIGALLNILKSHDDEFGGFGQAPKFPPSMTLDFLSAMRATSLIDDTNPKLARRIDGAVNTTLTGMAHGGLYDQVGGGFTRYSVDRHWIIPHFEKMLYDNGLLLEIYSRSYRRYPKELYRCVVEETIEWLRREMLSPRGGFFSSLDADSEGEEGKFYVWNPQEVAEVLGAERGVEFCQAYGISEEGNFEHGKSNPVLLAPEIETRFALADQRAQLFEARSRRVPPGKDSKRIVAWNCLAVRGLAEAGFTFGRRDWHQLAVDVLEWIWGELVTFDADGLPQLQSVAYDDRGCFSGTLSDYALLGEAHLSIAAVVEWSMPGEAPELLRRAEKIFDSVVRYFSDPDGSVGYFFTDEDHERLVHRKKEWFDNAMPAANSVLVHGFRDLYQLTGNAKWARALSDLKTAYPGIASRAPQAVVYALSGMVQEAMGVAVIKVKDVSDLEPLRRALIKRPWRRVFIERTESSEFFQGYQLCVGSQCLAPAVDPEEIAALL